MTYADAAKSLKDFLWRNPQIRRLSRRELLIEDLRRELAATCSGFVGGYVDGTVRNQMRLQVADMLDTMKAERKIYDFSVAHGPPVGDPSLHIFIQQNMSVEQIVMTIQIH